MGVMKVSVGVGVSCFSCLLLAVGVMKVHYGCNVFGDRCPSCLLFAMGVMKVQCGW